MLTLQTREAQQVAVLDIEGRLVGGPETTNICARVRELVAGGRTRILLNMEGVPWANSLGIGTLVSCYATARRQGVQLELCCLSARITMVLRTEKLIPVLFDPYRTEAEALAGFDRTRLEDHPSPE